MHALLIYAILATLAALLCYFAYRGQRKFNMALKARRDFWRDSYDRVISLLGNRSIDQIKARSELAEALAARDFWRTAWDDLCDYMTDRVLERNAARRELEATKELLEGQIEINAGLNKRLADSCGHIVARNANVSIPQARCECGWKTGERKTWREVGAALDAHMRQTKKVSGAFA